MFFVGNQGPNGQSLLEARGSKLEAKHKTPNPSQKIGRLRLRTTGTHLRHVLRPKAAQFALREGATAKYQQQVNEVVFLKTCNLQACPNRFRRTTRSIQKTQQKQRAGSRVRLRNYPRRATARSIPDRVGRELRANRCPSFLISSENTMVCFYVFLPGEQERVRQRSPYLGGLRVELTGKYT